MIYPLLESLTGRETRVLSEIMAERVLVTYKVWVDESDEVRAEPRPMEAIEPATTIDQEYLIPVPSEYDAFKLELRVVVAKGSPWKWLGWGWKKVWGKEPEKPGTSLSASTVVARVDK